MSDDMLDRPCAYVVEFRRGATQLRTLELGKRWVDAKVPVQDAIGWANAGYTPGEAAEHIANGVTPDTVTMMEQIDASVGGDEEMTEAEAAEHLREVMAGTGFIHPDRVIERVDPDDPTHIIVDILDEPAE